MRITTFKDIIAIDAELASLFLRPDEAVNWIYAVEHGIKDWVGKHNKQFWEVVRFVSEKRGILGQLRKDHKTIRLKREDFARVLLKFCPDAFEKGETVNKLTASMEHYPFKTELKKLDEQFSGHLARHHVKDVEDLLDNKPITALPEKESTPTLEDLLVTYLRHEVEDDEDKFPHSKVCIRPQYGDISPAISVETYKSKQFLKDHNPSHIETYEFIDGVLEEKKLNELTGQYQGKNVKLYIVSSSGLLPKVRSLALNRNIGFVRLNPNSEMTNENYILPRSIEDYVKRAHDLEVLNGAKPMSTPILIMDGTKLTSSLTDVLSDNDVCVKKHRLLNIPYLSDIEIEKKANEITKDDVEKRIQMLKESSLLNNDFSLDPFSYADSCGLAYDKEAIEGKAQLGRLDVISNRVFLNTTVLDNNNRYRFTMAHELGHHILHVPLFKDQGVVSIGESEETLSISKNDSKRLEYQANRFASCILMPEKLVRKLYALLFELFVHQVYGDSFHPLYFNPDQPETWKSFNGVVGNMARLLGVSLKAMKIRLLFLGLLKMPNEKTNFTTFRSE